MSTITIIIIFPKGLTCKFIISVYLRVKGGYVYSANGQKQRLCLEGFVCQSTPSFIGSAILVKLFNLPASEFPNL